MLMDESVKEISTDSIVTEGLNPRKTFDPEYIKELASSIRRDGQWNPIIVKPNSKGYDLIAGECRLRAVRNLGHKTIKARILNIDDNEACLLALKTNLMRRDMNPIEEGHGIKNIINMGWSIEKVAKELNKSSSWVYVRAKLVENASEGLQNALITQTIPLSYAIKISELSEALQGPTVDKVVRDRLNFKEANILVDLLKAARTPEDMESIFTAPKETIMSWGVSRSFFSQRLETSDNDLSIVECGCGTKFVVDWTRHNVVSKQIHRNQRIDRFFGKALKFLRKKV